MNALEGGLAQGSQVTVPIGHNPRLDICERYCVRVRARTCLPTKANLCKITTVSEVLSGTHIFANMAVTRTYLPMQVCALAWERLTVQP